MQTAWLELRHQLCLLHICQRNLDYGGRCRLFRLALLLHGREVQRQNISCKPRQASLPVPVVVDRCEGLHLYQASGKAGVVLGAKELSFESWRGDLKGIVCARHEVLDIENGSKVLRERGAVLVGDSGEHL